MSIILKHKPLVEAIFELKWELQERQKNIKVDPHYKILVGAIYDRIKDDYPYHESLPTAEMPDEIASYVVQHRFRVEKDKWPLIQIGPGIITVNDTEGYQWKKFEKMINDTVNMIFETYPKSDVPFRINSLLQRYIDSIPFDFEHQNILDFLYKEMKIDIKLYTKLFDEMPVSKSPFGIDTIFSFNLEQPKSVIHLRFVRGQKNGIDSLFWETIIQSKPEAAPQDQEKILHWAQLAHKITDDWFFKIIDGDLLKRFS